MSAQIDTIVIDCRDDHRLGVFWSAVLGYEMTVGSSNGVVRLRDPERRGPEIELQVVPEAKLVKNRVHIDLAVADAGLEVEVARLAALGAARLRYVENDPDESHWVMADPEGNEFCVLRPGWEPRPSDLVAF